MFIFNHREYVMEALAIAIVTAVNNWALKWKWFTTYFLCLAHMIEQKWRLPCWQWVVRLTVVKLWGNLVRLQGFFFSYYPQLWKNVFILIRIYSRYYYESSRYAELECVITSFSFSTKISESFEWQFHGGMKHGHYKSSFMGINEKRNASNNSLVFSFLECICRTR